MAQKDSRIPGFYRLPLERRRNIVAELSGRNSVELVRLLQSGGMTVEVADSTVENVIGTYSLPLGLALNFRINGVDRLVPMVVEEPSVIAAASNAARLARLSGGFQAEMVGTLMTGQIEVRGIGDVEASSNAVLMAKATLLEAANAAVPSLVRRGGGVREIEVRNLGYGTLVLHFHIDCKDAMGANLVNTVAEAIGADVATLAQGQLGLRILTNLCDRRRVKASCRIAIADLMDSKTLGPNETPTDTGKLAAQAIEAASHFASIDPYRAATHNKGIMNGIDAVAVATGNDYRAVEAGAHAWAARHGRYGSLAQWHVEGGFLEGQIELPLALGIVGGTIRVHPIAQFAIQLLGVHSASELSEVAACVGLASNFSALRALATEGIQRGHMSLQARSVALAAGAKPEEVDAVANALVRRGTINEATARDLLLELRTTTSERHP